MTPPPGSDQAQLALALDSWAPGQRPPRARRCDPESSHQGADELESSGRAGRQMLAALEAVRAHPGATTRELAERTVGPPGLDYGLWLHALGRRLPDLRRRGAVQRTRRDCEDFRWWLAGATIPPGVGEPDA